MISSLDYFSALSWWIANFGVVPWLRLRAFLFAPAFFSLLFFLIFVIRVLETIISLLASPYSQQSYNRTTFLTLKWIHVKVLLLLFTQCIHAKNTIPIIKLHPLEFHTLHLKPHAHFTISNRQILSTKVIPQTGQLIIKAKKIGTSELLILTHPNRRYKIEITPIHTSKIHAALPPNKQQSILSKITYYMLQANLDDFSCHFHNAKLLCYVAEQLKIPRPLQNLLKQNYNVTFVKYKKFHTHKYTFRFKLLLLESNSSQYIKLGIDNIYSNLQDLFDQPLLQLTHQQLQILGKHHLKLYSLAQEKFQAIEGLPTTLMFGAKSSYNETIIRNNQQYQIKKWLFTGLKAKFRFYKENGQWILNYNSSFTRPVGPENLSSNQQKGNLFIAPYRAEKLFEINYLATQDQADSIPGLSSIPILHHLFSSTQQQKIQKKIIGVLYVIP